MGRRERKRVTRGRGGRKRKGVRVRVGVKYDNERTLREKGYRLRRVENPMNIGVPKKEGRERVRNST